MSDEDISDQRAKRFTGFQKALCATLAWLAFWFWWTLYKAVWLPEVSDNGSE